MGRRGVPVGPARLPLGNPCEAQIDALMIRLDELGFASWGRNPPTQKNTHTGMMPLADFYRRQLTEDCMPFWFPRAVDETHGGFLHCFDRSGELVDDDKSVWAQGRMSWILLTLYLELEQRPEWLAWAESCLAFLEQKCVDPADGRMFFHVARDGTPLRKRRYAYSESFAAITHAAHASATGSPSSAERARHWFDRFTDWNFTPGRIPPKFTGARPMEGIGSRMITIVTAKELRKHLGEDPHFTKWIDRCLDDIVG